jgi:60 kDa SS-A/Ro ribonucleoprotein
MTTKRERSAYLDNIAVRTETPQTQAIPGREAEMHQMESGGFNFKKGVFGQLRRWLIVGSDKNEFYATKQVLTRDNAKNVASAFASDPMQTVDIIVDVSHRGLAPKNDAAIFALALCLEMAARLAIQHRDTGEGEVAEEWVAYIQGAAPRVCRIGTHLFQFATYLQALGILGNVRGRNAVASILNTWEITGLQMNMIKYRSRDGWTLAQLLDLIHPKTNDALRGAAYQWANWAEDRVRSIGRMDGDGDLFYGDILVDNKAAQGVLPNQTVIWMGSKHDEEQREYQLIDWHADLPLIWAFEQLRHETSKSRVVNLVTDYKLPWETLPDAWLNDKDVWAALTQHMGLTALIRNLGKLTSLGVIGLTGAQKMAIIGKLTDVEQLRRARIHPLNVLTAQLVYKQGKGDKGSLTWSPVQGVMAALETAFYGSFEAWEPTGKSRGLFIDVSGSMAGGYSKVKVGGSEITPCMIATVMAMCVARKEADHVIYGFADRFRTLGITASDSLDVAMQKAQSNRFGGTDATVAIDWAIKNKVKLDTFELFTDGQTWGGTSHITQAIAKYRKLVGDPTVKLMMLAITSAPWTFADPKDRMQADFPGFGADTPKLMEMFIRGELDVDNS